LRPAWATEKTCLKKKRGSWVPVLTPIIPATQEEEIRRMVVQNQPRQIVHKTLSQKKTHHKKNRGPVE
jgi:hypothetical protein